MFGLFLQVSVEVVNVSGALAVKAYFLLDQAVRVVFETVGFADFVFDLVTVPNIVVAILTWVPRRDATLSGAALADCAVTANRPVG